jgi:hypothetical protein
VSEAEESPSLIIKESLEEKGPAGLVSATVSFLLHASAAMSITATEIVAW